MSDNNTKLVLTKKEKLKKFLTIFFKSLIIFILSIWALLCVVKCSNTLNHYNPDITSSNLSYDVKRAPINTTDITSYYLGYSSDIQNYKNTSFYQYTDSSYTNYNVIVYTYDYYINVSKNPSNYNVIVGVGFSYDYVITLNDTDNFNDNELLNNMSGNDFYIDGISLDLNNYYQLNNSYLTFNLYNVNEFISASLSVLNGNNQVLYETNRLNIIDLADDFQPTQLIYSIPSIFNIKCDSVYYTISKADNYFNGYYQGVSDGENNVLNNLENYGLYNESQYINYGESQYQLGYNQNAQYDMETEGFLVAFNTIMNAPFNIFGNLLEFELFGVNLFNLFSFLITCGLCVFVLKLFL